MTIRTMRADDVEATLRIIRAHNSFDGRSARQYFRAYFADAARRRSQRERNFVAVDGATGEVVGCCGFQPDKYNWPGILWINWFYVAASHRRMGIGTMLMNHVLRQVRSLGGITKLYLDTASEEKYHTALKAYRRFGFRREGLLKDYYGEGDDNVILGLQLT